MSRFTAFIDTCALVPVALADTLLRLAEHGLYRPLWSEEILRETEQAIERIHPELAGLARRRTDAMREAFSDACVTGWEPLVTALTLPDSNDRHVLAAAIMGRADVIVTNNIKDFPEAVLEPLSLSAQTPDEFLLNQLDLDPPLVMVTIRDQSAAAKRPVITPHALLNHLAKCHVPRFAEAATQQLWRIGPKQ
mgnify:FL=1